MRIIIFFLTVVAVAFSCVGSETTDPLKLWKELEKNSVPNTLSKGEKKADWHLLFDGKTTEGWHGYNMNSFPDCWAVEDEALAMNTTGSGESLDILTNEVYRSFAFSVEYKLTKAANSGIIYQIKEDTLYKFPHETGPEFQVIDHENWHDPLEDWQINGSNYAMYPPAAKPYKPVGEWNRLLLVVNGNNVTQILNGEVVVQYEKYSEDWLIRKSRGKWKAYPDWGKFDEGRISLQNHGTKVWYRSVKIKII